MIRRVRLEEALRTEELPGAARQAGGWARPQAWQHQRRLPRTGRQWGRGVFSSTNRPAGFPLGATLVWAPHCLGATL